MEIRYKNKRIRDICENEKKAIKKYNKIIAEKLIFSIEFLKNSNSLKDVADYQNFRLHELKYERKGQFAIDLGKTTGYRLIIEPITDNKENETISYEWRCQIIMNKLVFKSKDNEMIFHPGYLIKNIMDEEGKDTKGMVQLLGLTEKEITALINAEISITDDMINRIVKNYGTSKELWKNFQNKYDLKMKELEENPMIFNFERENEISSDIANNILNNVSERLIIA